MPHVKNDNFVEFVTWLWRCGLRALQVRVFRGCVLRSTHDNPTVVMWCVCAALLGSHTSAPHRAVCGSRVCSRACHAILVRFAPWTRGTPSAPHQRRTRQLITSADTCAAVWRTSTWLRWCAWRRCVQVVGSKGDRGVTSYCLSAAEQRGGCRRLKAVRFGCVRAMMHTIAPS